MRAVSLNGGSGGGDGNSVAIPQPINEAPGLNAIWVFGENMQAALGLNHQVAVGSNQQVCINPAGLMAGMPGAGTSEPLLTGLLGGSAGGNLQLTYGSNVQLTMGQSIQINLGPKGINIDGDGNYTSHSLTFGLGGAIGVLASAYALAYGLLVKDNNYVECGTFTLVYQLAIDALLEAIMITETMIWHVSDSGKKGWDTSFVLKGLSSAAKPVGAPGVLASAGSVAALGALISETLLSALLDGREHAEENAS